MAKLIGKIFEDNKPKKTVKETKEEKKEGNK